MVSWVVKEVEVVEKEAAVGEEDIVVGEAAAQEGAEG